MKRHGILLLTGIAFLTIQSTVFVYLPIERIRPDIVLILILHWGFTLPPVTGGMQALFLGYLMDLFSGNSFGLYTFTRLVVFYLVQLFKSRFYLESILSQSLFVFIFALLEGLFILAFLSALNPAPLGNLYPLFLTFYLPQSLLTAIIAPVVFFLLQRLSFTLFQRKETLGGIGRR